VVRGFGSKWFLGAAPPGEVAGRVLKYGGLALLGEHIADAVEHAEDKAERSVHSLTSFQPAVGGSWDSVPG